MNKFIRSVKIFFTYHRADRLGFLVLLILLLAVLLFPYFRKSGVEQNFFDNLRIEKFERSLAIADSLERAEMGKDSLFSFNPNTIDSITFRRLGFTARQTLSILKYRSKGGVFRQVSDFSRLYVVSTEEYERLKPYIVIENKEKKLKVIRVELNLADTLALESLRGIGPYYAGKILKYRARLGGFAVAEQLLEINGIDEERFDLFRDQIVLDTTFINKISLNTATLEELKAHPYVSAALAKKILKYRNKKGDIPVESIEELLHAGVLNTYQVKQLKPYLKF